MKLRYIIASFAAAAALAAGCTVEDPVSHLENLEVSNDYFTLAADEGSTETITVKAESDWTVDIPEDVDWVSVTPASGSAGQEVTVTFTTLSEASADRSATIKILMGDAAKLISVHQASKAAEGGEAAPSSCKEVNDGPDATYRVTGTVTKIANTHYGNWYINDGTVDGDGVYVYGTLDKKGNDNKSANTWDNLNDPKYADSWELSIGDVVTIEGPKQVYNGTVELVNVTILSIVKSLLEVAPSDAKVGKDGGNAEFKVVYKGDDLKVTPKADWLSLGGVSVGKDTTVVTVTAAPNEGDTRIGEVVISSSIPGQTSEMTVVITQATGLSMYTVPFEESFAAGFGGFEVNVITPRADGGDIWTTGEYGGVSYAKASAGSKTDTKSMLVSPKISLAGVASPVVSFKHCGKYCGDQAEELTFWVSTDNCETWKQLLIPNAHDNAYGWTPSGDISLASLAGAEYVNFAFQYVSNANYYGTWEISEVKLEDRTPAFTTIAEINNFASATEAEWSATLTDAVVSYVNGKNVFIQDATGGIQLYLADSGLAAGSTINGKVSGKVKLYNGYAELTALDTSAATVATGDAPAPIVMTVDQLLKDYLRYQNCLVKLEGVKFTTALTTSNRNGVVDQDGVTINAYAQIKEKIESPENTLVDLVCIPTRYNATLQVGVWENEHITKK